MDARLPYLLCDPPGAPRTLLCVVDGPGATWRISFERPLAAARAAGDVRLLALTEAAVVDGGLDLDRLGAWLRRERVETLILSRVNGSSVRPLLTAARACGVASVYFLDDDLLAVPDELGAAKVEAYRRPERLAAICHGLSHADLVYASTSLLGDRLRAYAGHVPVVAGTMYCAAGAQAPLPAARPRRFGYMGTGGHAADLAHIGEAISAVLAARDDAEFMLFGTLKRPDWLDRWGTRVLIEPGVADYDAFLAKLATLDWAAALAPLAPTPFNMVKANTKFIEYTGAAMPTVVSAGPVYAEAVAAGVTLGAATTAEWAAAIGRLLDDPAAGPVLVRAAQAFVTDRYATARLTEQLVGVLDEARAIAAAR